MVFDTQFEIYCNVLVFPWDLLNGSSMFLRSYSMLLPKLSAYMNTLTALEPLDKTEFGPATSLSTIVWKLLAFYHVRATYSLVCCS